MATILEYIQKSGLLMSEVADLAGLSRPYSHVINKIKKISRNKLIQLAVGINLTLTETEDVLSTHGYKKMEWSDAMDILMVIRNRRISGTWP